MLASYKVIIMQKFRVLVGLLPKLMRRASTREKLTSVMLRSAKRAKNRTDAAMLKMWLSGCQKNKEEQERKRLGVQERRKERMWHKVERASNRKLKFTSRDDGTGVSGGEYVEDSINGSDNGGDNLVSGVNIMPCLVSINRSPRSTNHGGDSSLGTPPSSPLREESPRRSSRLNSGSDVQARAVANKRNPFFLSAADSDGGLTTDGNTDCETSPTARTRRPAQQQTDDGAGAGDSPFSVEDSQRVKSVHQSPRKQFRSAIANVFVELASDLFDRPSASLLIPAK